MGEGGALAGVFGAERLRFTAMGWGGGGAMGGAYLYAAMAVATGQANYVAVTRSIVQSPDNRFGAGFARAEAADEAAGRLCPTASNPPAKPSRWRPGATCTVSARPRIISARWPATPG